MKLGNFELSVLPGRELAGGYVEMEHGTQYRLFLHNFGRTRCDAEVTIDGKPMGAFRISPSGMLTLERPANDSGKFTFYRSGSNEAAAIEMGNIASSNLGVVSVKFMPERYIERPKSVLRAAGFGSTTVDCFSDEVSRSMNALPSRESLTAGGTGLSGVSSQQFYEVASLDYDPSGEVTINLRLVCSGVAAANEPRPLTPVSNAAPSPVAR